MAALTPNDELCALCRAGKLYAVEKWFKAGNKPDLNPPRRNRWAMGIAIEKGFHSLVEVLLRNGVPADADALDDAVSQRRIDLVELLIQFGANINMISFAEVVSTGSLPMIRLFLDRGANLFHDWPFYRGLIGPTRMWLGLYKQYRPQHPDLQYQADMALRHFVEEGSLRGVSLLMWLGANPRGKAPDSPDYEEESQLSALEGAAYKGNLDIIKRLRPDPKQDDVNRLLRCSVLRQDMNLVRYWIGLGADVNYVDSDGESSHRNVIWEMWWHLNSRISCDPSGTTTFAKEWFSRGAKWMPQSHYERRIMRDCFKRMSAEQILDFIKHLRANDVIPPEILAGLLDTPKFRAKLESHHMAFVEILPGLKRWVKAKMHPTSGMQRTIQRNKRVYVATLAPADPFRSYHGTELVREPTDD